MRDNQVLFVTCVNDDALYAECVKSIKNVFTSSTIAVDFLSIKNAKSMTSGYNQALHHKAKYKVYLHQDVRIINSLFLVHILHLFQKNPQLGLLGMAGCKKLPPHGVWWEGEGLKGKVKMNSFSNFGEVQGDYEEVEVVDGVLMATQYDVKWREDLFTDFHFYDISQSLEFRKKGYSVGVPNQIEPWCYHLDNDVAKSIQTPEYIQGQSIFIKHYLKGFREEAHVSAIDNKHEKSKENKRSNKKINKNNGNTFQFIVCVSDDNLFQECVRHIKKLEVPQGYNVQISPVYGAKSMTQGYNIAASHKAKYKIYLHQDTYILKKNILHHLLDIFITHKDLGVLGMIGCRELGASGVWWEGKGLVGEMIGYHKGKNLHIGMGKAKKPYEVVESLDGFFMATQYDLPWREEITGFHFYDASQGIEFIKAGYKVGVLHQETPWTAHINKEKKIIYDQVAYAKCQQVFLQHYGKHLLSSTS